MTPQALAERLHAECGSHLKSVVLYGSAVAGDHTGKRSDYNVLIVLDQLGPAQLQALAPLVRSWVKAGNLPPLLLTQTRLAQAAELFPLEIADLKDSHRLLFGEDMVSPLSVHTANLRFQLEHELNGKLMQLRSRYLLARGNRRSVTELMIRSLSSFLVLCRGALRLYQPTVPAKKLEALGELAKYIPIHTQVFEAIAQLKAGQRAAGYDPEELFAEYLRMIELVVDAAASVLHASRSERGEVS